MDICTCIRLCNYFFYDSCLASNAECVTISLQDDLMEKSMTLNLRVNPVVKQQAEEVLKQLGIPMATAIDMYLRQIPVDNYTAVYVIQGNDLATRNQIAQGKWIIGITAIIPVNWLKQDCLSQRTKG